MFESIAYRGETESQADILSYWHSKRRDAALPLRTDIDPGALRSHLAYLSIIEFDGDGGMRFRIAGSRVRRILGRDMSGQRLDSLTGAAADMWSLGLSAAIERGAPTGGLIERQRDCHAWLRLPIRCERTGAYQVLCHDDVTPKDRHRINRKQSNALSSSNRVLAA